MKALNWT